MTPDIEQIYQSIGAKLLSIGEDGVMSADVFYLSPGATKLIYRFGGARSFAAPGTGSSNSRSPTRMISTTAATRLSDAFPKAFSGATLRERGLSPESMLPEELLSPGFAFFEEQRAEDALPVTEEEMGDAFKAFAFGHPAFMAVRGRRPQTVEFRFGSV